MAVSEEEMQKIFKRFDANGDGKISPAEIADALKSLGSGDTNPDEIKVKMSEIDTDGDGFIDYNELVEFAKAHPGPAKDLARLC